MERHSIFGLRIKVQMEPRIASVLFVSPFIGVFWMKKINAEIAILWQVMIWLLYLPSFGIPTNRPWASNNHDQLLLSVILVLEKNHWDHLKHLIPVVIISTLNRLKTWTYLLNLLLRKSSIPIFIQPESNTCAHPEWMVRLLKYRALRGK